MAPGQAQEDQKSGRRQSSDEARSTQASAIQVLEKRIKVLKLKNGELDYEVENLREELALATKLASRAQERSSSKRKREPSIKQEPGFRLEDDEAFKANGKRIRVDVDLT